MIGSWQRGIFRSIFGCLGGQTAYPWVADMNYASMEYTTMEYAAGLGII